MRSRAGTHDPPLSSPALSYTILYYPYLSYPNLWFPMGSIFGTHKKEQDSSRRNRLCLLLFLHEDRVQNGIRFTKKAAMQAATDTTIND